MENALANSNDINLGSATSEPNLLSFSIDDFLNYLKRQRIHRFFISYDDETKKFEVSHPALSPIRDFLQNDKRDFAEHEALFFQTDPHFHYLMGAFIHWTYRGQGHGGARLWNYSSIGDFIRDGLRLSQGMTQKNALAYLWWGGGKGVISCRSDLNTKDRKTREEIFKNYGKFLSSLKGCYYSAEDVGVTAQDLDAMFSETRFMSCIAPTKGGSGNPSHRTAQGVARAIEAALQYADTPGISGKTFAVQGLGNVGSNLCQILFDAGASKIVASDLSEENIENAKEKFSKFNFEARLTHLEDFSILEEACDVLVPCATGGILNSRSIPKLKCRIVCGGANNQLEDPARDSEALLNRKIIYVPDFLANRMGIVNCANEQYGQLDSDPLIEKHLSKDWEYSVFQTTLRVLNDAHESGESPAKIAIERANELAKERHPLFGRRGKQIIQSIIQSSWSND